MEARSSNSAKGSRQRVTYFPTFPAIAEDAIATATAFPGERVTSKRVPFLADERTAHARVQVAECKDEHEKFLWEAHLYDSGVHNYASA
jgi:hypothetical protein